MQIIVNQEWANCELSAVLKQADPVSAEVESERARIGQDSFFNSEQGVNPKNLAIRLSSLPLCPPASCDMTSAAEPSLGPNTAGVGGAVLGYSRTFFLERLCIQRGDGVLLHTMDS